MARLLVHVEGITERQFVNTILNPHLLSCGYQWVSARLMGNALQNKQRGGVSSWQLTRRDLLAHLKNDPQAVATTMVDYYGLPDSGNAAWPGKKAAVHLPFPQKAASVEAALLADLQQGMGKNFDPRRFVPYVMMHEFESLLFSDCRRFAEIIGQPQLTDSFQIIRNQFSTPEEINDSPTTAPSKRILDLVPNYRKPLLGNRAIIEIGLDKIRAECPHFNGWIERLEERAQIL
ncbi:MAG TPA: DUF4276 family protein [Blastocatellia bacterium]|nr:DUF4276 family protein [Blastocatellia bacterium]HMV82699.1 DUF4276 family protein [Blastocatellia bacterium]HMX26119.1 DUF4276 family protein [Blastocatellia bacterium]HMY72710.1 DUF4276 family protein [Blastocatellia bacterium]HMZ16784.1 DUF4276 family protein [Blastocatellia bacterium]